MRTDLTIEIVVLIEKASGRNQVVYLSNLAEVDPALDLYVSEVNRHIALYHRDGDQDDQQTPRRSQSGLFYPGSTEKMMYVGELRSKLDFDAESHVEVSRAQLHLKNIPIDESPGISS
ncbi:hypothetical protein BH11PSE11_BH11PSE11_05130 [soil metagenome]